VAGSPGGASRLGAKCSIFSDGTDGGLPEAGVIQDPHSNLYGTTLGGGSPYYGVVFKLNTAGTETVLYRFTDGLDGGIPFTPVARCARRDADHPFHGPTSRTVREKWGTPYSGSGFRLRAPARLR
jgi:uncharacterized repeat protein (TIGR03803 family)